MTALTGSLLWTADGARLTWRGYLALALAALAVLSSGLTTIPPIDRDEPRFAQASKQMIESGNYLDIHFMQETRYKKPAGIYWLQSASARLFGTPPYDTPWPYRLPSLFGALAAVLMTAWGVSRFHGARTGLLAAAILLATPLLNFEARIAKTDAALLATIVTTQFILARAWLDPAPLPRRLVALFWIAEAAGILIKGPLTPGITLGTFAALGIMTRRLGWVQRLHPLPGLAFCAAMVAPWLIWIGHVSHGKFYSESVDHDFLGKILTGQDRGFLPPGYHLGLFLILFSPSVWLALRGLAALWRERITPAAQFMLAWIVPVWIVNELIFTKLPHYVLPCYPALAWAAAWAWTATPSIPITRFWRWLNIVCGVLMLAVAAALALLPLFAQVPFLYRSAGLCLLAMALIVAQTRWQLGRPVHALACALCAAALLLKAGFGILLPGLQPILLTPLATAVYDGYRPCAFSRLVTSGYTEPSLVFTSGTNTIFANGAAYAGQLLAHDSCTLVMIAPEQEPAFQIALLLNRAPPIERLGTITGFNYNGGQWRSYAFYRQRLEPRFSHAE